MSACGKLDTGFDGPIPVADPFKENDLTGFKLEPCDAFCALVLAVEFAAAVGALAYLLIF